MTFRKGVSVILGLGYLEGERSINERSRRRRKELEEQEKITFTKATHFTVIENL